MVVYNLAHLTQDDSQEVIGPIQDDEALFLFSLIRCGRFSRILEVGGLDGYSARNFIAAVKGREDAAVYTVDVQPVAAQDSIHKCIQKDAAELRADDIDNQPLDLLFFDCHEEEAQWGLFENLRESSTITPDTLIVLHDTGLHDANFVGWAYEVADGWVHQPVERRMANELKKRGYEVLHIHAKPRGDKLLPYRHGLTICRLFNELKT